MVVLRDSALFSTLVEHLDAKALVPWVRWVTPEISPKRFDARFFLARAPEGPEPRPPPVLMPLVWNEDGRAYISPPGAPRHAMPDVLGGSIFRIQLEAGRYRAVGAV